MTINADQILSIEVLSDNLHNIGKYVVASIMTNKYFLEKKDVLNVGLRIVVSTFRSECLAIFTVFQFFFGSLNVFTMN